MNMYTRSNAIKSLVSVFALSLALITTSFSSLAAIPMAQLSSEQRSKTEAMLTQHIQRIVDRQKRVEGQGKFVRVQVRLDPSEGFIRIDLSRSYLPTHRQALEDLCDQLLDEASFLLQDSVIIHGIDFTFEGKDVYEYFPAENPILMPKEAGLYGSRGDLVVISAGHGKYFHFNRPFSLDGTWRWQRPEISNGVLEDLNNALFANELSFWFFQRSFEDVAVTFPRSLLDGIHEPSGEEWWKVAGKYHLQSVYPDNPQIWNFGSDTTSTLRDYYRDVNSRPKYANYLAANALINLHSDATKDGDPTPRGLKLFYHTGRAADRLLGNSILCSMKEIIQAQDAYATFPIETNSRASTIYGENALAQMPAVLLELGFRTNPTDAAALLDSVFQTAAMKGVEKGYRLYREGTPCEPFEVTSIPDVSGPHNANIPAQVNYVGNPQFPVRRRTQIVSCATDWICSDYHQTYLDSVPSPLAFNFRCDASPSRPAATFRWRTTLTDADGVVTNAVEHNSTCTPTSQPAPGVPSSKPTISSGSDS